jgi:hypothetical protein
MMQQSNKEKWYTDFNSSGKKTYFATYEEEIEESKKLFKNCNKCLEEYALTEFGENTSSSCHFNKEGRLLRRGDCKKCNLDQRKGNSEAKNLAKQLGIPFKAPAETECEICHKKNIIVFDHDHKTNKFRGWLCNTCNIALGSLGDDVKGLINALNYLQKNEKLELSIDPTTQQIIIID